MRICASAQEIKLDLFHQILSMVTQVAASEDGEKILRLEASESDLSRFVTIVAPVFAIEANHDDMVGEIVRHGRDVAEALETKAVVPCCEVADFSKSIPQGEHRRSHIRGERWRIAAGAS